MSGRYGRDEALFVRVFLLSALLLAGLFLLILLAALAAAALLTALLSALAALSALALTALTLLVVLPALAALLSGTVHIISHREFSIVVDRTLPHEKNLCAYDWFLVAEQQIIGIERNFVAANDAILAQYRCHAADGKKERAWLN